MVLTREILRPMRWWRLGWGKVEEPRIEQLYLVHRHTGAILQHALRLPEALDEAAREELRGVGSMVTYLLAFLREPENLSHYLRLRMLRVERFTYGFHGGDSCVLVSVIRTPHGVEVARKLEECDGIVGRIEAEHGRLLRDIGEHPGVQLPGMLPGFSS